MPALAVRPAVEADRAAVQGPCRHLQPADPVLPAGQAAAAWSRLLHPLVTESSHFLQSGLP